MINWIESRFSIAITGALLVCVKGTRSNKTITGHYLDDSNLVNLTFIYSQNGRSIPYKFEDYLKVDFHDWMTIRMLLCY